MMKKEKVTLINFQFPLLGSGAVFGFIRATLLSAFNSPYWVQKWKAKNYKARKLLSFQFPLLGSKNIVDLRCFSMHFLSIPLIGFNVDRGETSRCEEASFQFPLLGSWVPFSSGDTCLEYSSSFNSPYWVHSHDFWEHKRFDGFQFPLLGS